MEVLAMTAEGLLIRSDAGVVVVSLCDLQRGHLMIGEGVSIVLQFVSGFLLGVDAAND